MGQQGQSSRRHRKPCRVWIDRNKGLAWTSFFTSASVVAGNTSTPAIVKPTGALLTTLYRQEPFCSINLAGISGGLTVRNSGVSDTHTSKPRSSGLFCGLLKTRSLAIRPWRFSCFLGHVHKVGNRPCKQTKPELTVKVKVNNHEEIYQL